MSVQVCLEAKEASGKQRRLVTSGYIETSGGRSISWVQEAHFWGSSVGSISLISSSDTIPGWSAGMQPWKHLGILWTLPDSKK